MTEISICFILLTLTLSVQSTEYIEPEASVSKLCFVGSKPKIYVVDLGHQAPYTNVLQFMPITDDYPVCTNPQGVHNREVMCSSLGCELWEDHKDLWKEELWEKPMTYPNVNLNASKTLNPKNKEHPNCFTKDDHQCLTVDGEECYGGLYNYFYHSQWGDQSFAEVPGSGFKFDMDPAQNYMGPDSWKIIFAADVNSYAQYKSTFGDYAAEAYGPITVWQNQFVQPICPTAVVDHPTYYWNYGVTVDGTFGYSRATAPDHLYPDVACVRSGVNFANSQPIRSWCHNETVPVKWGINFKRVDRSTCSFKREMDRVVPSKVGVTPKALQGATATWAGNSRNALPRFPADDSCIEHCETTACDGDFAYETYLATINTDLGPKNAESQCYCQWSQPISMWWRRNSTNPVDYTTAYPILPIEIEGDPDNYTDFAYARGFFDDYGSTQWLSTSQAVEGSYYKIRVNVKMAYEVSNLNVRNLNKDLVAVSCAPIIQGTELSVPCSEDVTVIMSFLSYGFTKKTVDKVLITTLPPTVLSQEGTMYFTFLQGSTQVGAAELRYFPPSPCLTQDCYFCSDSLKNFDCQSSAMKAAIITIITLASAAALIALGILCYFFVVVAKVVGCTCYYTCCCCSRVSQFAKNGYTAGLSKIHTGYKLATAVSSTTTRKDDAPKRRQVTTHEWAGAPTSRDFVDTFEPIELAIVMIVCALLVPTVAAQPSCYGGLTIESATSICTLNTTHEACSVQYSVLLSIPFSHASACLAVYNKANDTIVGYFEVQYMETVTSMSMLNLYSTSSWTGCYEEVTDCWTPSNWCGDRCSDGTILPTDRQGWDRLRTACVINNPGITWCERTCGCAGCNCFYCNDACTTKRWAIDPKAPYARLYSPGVYTQKPMIRFNYSFDGVNYLQTETVPMVPGYVLTLPGGMELELIGQLNPPVTTIGDKKIRIDESGFTALTDACPANQPCSGLPGDIQASSTLDLKAVGRREFNVYNQLRVGQGFVTPGMDRDLGIPLPGIYNGRTWTVVGQSLESTEVVATPVLMKLNMPVPVSVSRKLLTVCPSFSVVAFGGCYSCPSGGWVKISALSTCLAGVATPDSTTVSVLTAQIYLTQVAEEHTIRYISSTKEVSGTLTLSSGSFTVSRSFGGILEDWTNFVKDGNFTPGAVVLRGTSDDSWSGFGDFFSDVAFGSLTSGIISVLLLIAGIYLVIKVSMILADKTAQACQKWRNRKQKGL